VSEFEKGDIVEFKNPVADDIGFTFVVLEIRGPRLLVGVLETNFSIPPTAVYLACDMRKVQEVRPSGVAERAH